MIETVSRDIRRTIFIGEKNMSHFPFRGSPSNTQVSLFHVQSFLVIKNLSSSKLQE